MLENGATKTCATSFLSNRNVFEVPIEKEQWVCCMKILVKRGVSVVPNVHWQRKPRAPIPFVILSTIIVVVQMVFEIRVNAKLYTIHQYMRWKYNKFNHWNYPQFINRVFVLKSVCATNSNEEAMRLVERSKNGTEKDDYFIGWVAGWLLAWYVGCMIVICLRGGKMKLWTKTGVATQIVWLRRSNTSATSWLLWCRESGQHYD